MRTAVLLVCILAGSGAAMPAAELLTPKPGPAPKINGPRVYGARPGKPFLYRIPCTGERPIAFRAAGLPGSLKLDASSGIVSGTAPAKAGEYKLTFEARNRHGSAKRAFRIVVGETLALTPPMGWNHWYTYYSRVSDALFREAADAMIASGMADFGYQYVNIDDCWMVRTGTGQPRGADGAILPNEKFPNMRGLTDYIHAKGLKAGIYTSPGPQTCARFEGSYQHEEVDARQFAAWGFDFLKYDWCSYTRVAGGKALENLQAPYRKMSAILEKLDRDVVFNLCQYGMGDVWKWGREVGGHCWRTTGDLGLEKDDRLPGFFRIGLKNAKHYEYARPGAWNYPDYILIGYIGNARKTDEPAKMTALTPDEQYAYMSMWALMAAPLVYSGDMSRLGEFTLNVLCNSEVIDVDQDPLGKQARIVRQSEEELVLAKPMEDGSVAVGLFNLGETEKPVGVKWEELGVKGRQRVRDVWRQKDLGAFAERYEVPVARHGVRLVRVAR
jgi:alpha-galactosidase